MTDKDFRYIADASKMFCPFCGAELLSDPEYLHSEHLHCENADCIFPSTVELHSSVWQKMIDGKKAQDALKQFKEKEIEIEVINGCEGRSLYMDNYRVAGSKPWGGGTVLQTWHVRGADIIDAFQELQIASITKRSEEK